MKFSLEKAEKLNACQSGSVNTAINKIEIGVKNELPIIA
jgi:hypothetical protein